MGGRWMGVAVAALVLGAGVPYKRWSYRATPHVSQTGAPPAAPAAAAGGVPRFVEVTKEAGLSYSHAKLTPHASVSRVAPLLWGLAGASAAVVDYDGDGRPDIYLTSSEKGSRNALYRNNGNGTFTESAAKAGLADVNREAGSLRALFFDADNDGDRDLLLSTTYCPKFFLNDGRGRFSEAPARGGVDHCGYAYATNVVDFDRDGLLDLVIADYYGDVDLFDPKRTDFIFNRVSFADNGGPILVYRNAGGRFERVPDSLGLKSPGFVHAVGVWNLFGKGGPDLFVATDFNSDRLWRFENGRWTDASKTLRPKFSHFGMSAEIGEIDDDGRPAVYVADIYEPGYTASENSLWKLDPSGRWSNEARERGVARCGWSWGAKFLDLDRDGRQDLIVSNGMVSGSRKSDYWYRQGVVGGGLSSISGDARNWPPFKDSSWSGHQTDCVFLNRGKTFEDVTAASGFDSGASDGRALAVLDALGDGRSWLVEASVGQPVKLYRIEADPANAWIGFELIGRAPRDPFGARLELELEGGRRLVRELQPANGFQGQSDPRLLVGLGRGARIARARVRWPGGAVQDLGAPEPGRYHRVTEAR